MDGRIMQDNNAWEVISDLGSRERGEHPTNRKIRRKKRHDCCVQQQGALVEIYPLIVNVCQCFFALSTYPSKE
jgi:hypothetical protein